MAHSASLDADCLPVCARDEEFTRLVARNDRLEAENEALRSERERLKARVAGLEGRVEELRRKARRQAAPFSRGQRRRSPGRGGRRPGAGYGRRAHRPAPGEVDETLTAPLAERCDCGGEICHERSAYQYQTELPDRRPTRRRIAVHVGRCRGCGRRHQGRHPFQTSDALGAAGSMLGPCAVALATQLNKELGLSPKKTAAMLGQFGISVTSGGIVGAVARQARSLGPTYDALVEGVRASEAVAPDETGWRVEAEKAWLWAFVGDEGVTVYLIARGRGYEQAERILGAEFAGVLERDGWAPYRRFTHATHQSCVAHLLRRAGEMIADSVAGQARIPHAVRRLLLDALAVRDRHSAALGATGDEVVDAEAVEIAADGEAAAAGADRASISKPAPSEPAAGPAHPALAGEVAALEERLDALCERSPAHRPNQRLLRHLRTEREALLTFLTQPGVEATNWRAEQAIRPAVVNRKSWGGNRSWRGAGTQQVAMSVIRTARQQGADPIELMAAAQREVEPTAAEMLRIPARASPADLPAAA